MKRWSAVRYLLLLLVCICSLSCAVPVTAEQAEETEIQLIKAEGTVNVISAAGRTLQRFANMKLCAGYQIQAEEDGSAWISPGSEAQIRLDAGSRMEVRTAGTVPEILLDAGSLYFRVDCDPDSEAPGIRTAYAALKVQKACGWVKVVDRRHTLVCLLEGSLPCSVTDPVTGQVKHAVLTAGQQAECVVYVQDQNGERCDILLREYAAEEIDAFVLDEIEKDSALCGRIAATLGADLTVSGDDAGRLLETGREKLAEAVDAARRKNQEYAHMKDPVWIGDRIPVLLAEETVSEHDQGEEASVQESFGTARRGSENSGSTLKIPDALQVPGSVQQESVALVPAGMTEPEREPHSSGSSGKKRKPSSSAPSEPSGVQVPSAPSNPGTPPASEVPSTPEEPSVPAVPEVPVQGEPTENKGLVVDGIHIARNGPDGVIEVTEGGRVTFADVSVPLYNEGSITNAGIVEGAVCNEAGSTLTNTGTISSQVRNAGGIIHMAGGTVGELAQESGSTRISGGTVTDGCAVSGGGFQMTGGLVKAGNAASALELNMSSGAVGRTQSGSVDHARVSVIGGTVFGDGTDKAAIRVENGSLLLGKGAFIKAGNVFGTFSGSGSGSWEVSYGGNVIQSGGPAAIYVTKEDADGMMCLRNLETDFAEVAQAEDGDTITLSGDTAVDVPADTHIDLSGGTADVPVKLDLNGKILAIKNRDDRDCLIWSKAAWDIVGGSLAFEYPVGNVRMEDHSTVTISEVELPKGGYKLYNKNYSRLTISDSDLKGFDIHNTTFSELTVQESEIGFVYNNRNSIADIKSSEMSGVDNNNFGRFTVAEKSTIGRSGQNSVTNAGHSTLFISDSKTWEKGLYLFNNQESDCMISSGSVIRMSGENSIHITGTKENRFTLSDSVISMPAGYAIPVLDVCGPFRMVNGTVEGSCEVIRKNGYENPVFEMTGGTVTEGCNVSEGGTFRMTDGTLGAGGSAAALRLSGGQALIEGGTISGDGEDKAAVEINSGNIQIAAEAVIKAANAVNTVRMNESAGGTLGYGPDTLTAPLKIYVTQEDKEDHMMCLKRLDTDFARAAQGAEAGDVITLGEDVTYTGTVNASGGSETSPVVLDLNGKELIINNPENDYYHTFCLSSSVWEMKDQDKTGKISIRHNVASSSTPSCIHADNSSVSISGVVVDNDILNENHGRLTISNSEVSSIDNENYSTADITGTVIRYTGQSGTADRRGGEIHNTDNSTMRISGNSRIHTFGPSFESIGNEESSTMIIQDTEISVMNGILNDSSSEIEISDSSIEIRKYRSGEPRISNNHVFKAHNSQIIPGNTDEGVQIENTGFMELSETALTGGINHQGEKCVLSQCRLTVVNNSHTYGIQSGAGSFIINGGTYTLPENSTLKSMILFNATGRSSEHILEIGGSAKLDTSGSEASPLVFYSRTNLPVYNFDVSINEAQMIGGDNPALKCVIALPESLDEVHTQNLAVNEGAVLSSEWPRGTVMIAAEGNSSGMRFMLNGGSIINEGAGPVLNIRDFGYVSDKINTEIKAGSEYLLARWISEYDLEKYELPGYTAEKKDDYYYLVEGNTAVTEISDQSSPENGIAAEAAEPEALPEESDTAGATEEDSKDTSICL